MHYEDGDLYEGEWIEDKREGYGVMKFVDNLKYKGEFKSDALNGKGTLYDKDDNVLYEGLWRNSKPFSEEEMLRQESLQDESTLLISNEPKDAYRETEQPMAMGSGNNSHAMMNNDMDSMGDSQDEIEEEEGEDGEEYTDEEGEEYSDEELEDGEFTDEDQGDVTESEGRTTGYTLEGEKSSTVNPQSHTDELIMEIKQSILERTVIMESENDNIISKSGCDTLLPPHEPTRSRSKNTKSQTCEDSPGGVNGLLLSDDSLEQHLGKNNLMLGGGVDKKSPSKSPRKFDEDSCEDGGPDLCR